MTGLNLTPRLYEFTCHDYGFRWYTAAFTRAEAIYQMRAALHADYDRNVAACPVGYNDKDRADRTARLADDRDGDLASLQYCIDSMAPYRGAKPYSIIEHPVGGVAISEVS